jgi:hypothetical protein
MVVENKAASQNRIHTPVWVKRFNIRVYSQMYTQDREACVWKEVGTSS